MSDQERFVREADNMRFQLGRMLRDARVLGDDMDAPVKLADLMAVEFTSMGTFMRRYDEAREALTGE